MGKMNTVNDLLKKPLYSGYSTGFTLQTILPAYKVCLKKKNSFPERWNSGYFTNKLKIKNGGHGNCELVQDSSHELKVKSYFNVISIMQTKRNFNAIKKYFLHLKEGTASLTFDKQVNIWKWGVWCFQSVNDTVTGKKSQLFSPGAYPRFGHIRKELSPLARNSLEPLAENPYPGDIPVQAKHETDLPITEKNLFGHGIILFRNRSLVYRFLRNIFL